MIFACKLTRASEPTLTHPWLRTISVALFYNLIVLRVLKPVLDICTFSVRKAALKLTQHIILLEVSV